MIRSGRINEQTEAPPMLLFIIIVAFKCDSRVLLTPPQEQAVKPVAANLPVRRSVTPPLPI